ncbi:MAG: metallophosphoesterase [Oscillospiraceae bacterium]|nr:metallophosphoesterase [Oscillospiraceae bacterium]
MRIVVMSDSHGIYCVLDKIVSAHPEADLYIHLGDGQKECDLLRQLYPDKNFCFIRGNCDTSSELPLSQVIKVNNDHTIFAAHGHTYNVKYGLSAIRKEAKCAGADIILFGHSHFRYCGYEDETWIMNPGSCMIPRDGNKPSYGIVDVTDSGVMTNIVSIS